MRRIERLYNINGVEAFEDEDIRAGAICYFIEGTQQNYLIDCLSGADGDSLARHLPTDKPLAILLTHLHADHAGGLNDFGAFPQPVTVYVHENSITKLSNNAEFDENWVRKNKKVTELMKVARWNGAIEPLSNRQMFDIDGVNQLECIHTPGHTESSVCFRIPQRNQLFTGDTYYPTKISEIKNLTFYSTEKLAESLQKLLGLASEDYVFLPGHYYAVNHEQFEKEAEKIIEKFTPKQQQQKRQKCGTCLRWTNLVCGECKTTFYCGTACQAQDWPMHPCSFRKSAHM